MAIPQHRSSNTVPAKAFNPAAAGPVAVGQFIAPIAGKTLSRGGAVMAGLVAQWAAISGPALAAYTMPAKLTKAAPENGFAVDLRTGSTGGTGRAGSAQDGEGSRRPASMLHLKVDPAKALEVQYSIPQLVERINQALGYKAVAGIRLVQAPVFVGKRPAAPKRVSPVPAPVPVATSPAGEAATATPSPQAPQTSGRLGAALARMAAGVKTRQAQA